MSIADDWNRFYESGKIDDYLKYVQHKNSIADTDTEVDANADKDTGNNIKAAQYR